MKIKFTPEELQAIQLEIEAQMFGNGIERFNKNNQRAIESGSASDTAWFRRLTKLVIEPYASAITAYLDYYTGRAGKPSRSIAYLKMLSPETAAYVGTKIIFDSLPVEGLCIQMIAEKIGRRIEDQVRFTKTEEAAPKYIQAIKDGLKRAKSKDYEHQQTVLIHAEKLLHEQPNKNGYVNNLERWQDWPKTDVVQLGSLLIDIFQKNVTYKDEPLIYKDVKDLSKGRSKAKSVCYLSCSEHIISWIEEFKEAVSQLSPCYAPLVVPPRNWTSPTIGGFHTLEVSSKMKMVKADSFTHLKRLTQKQMPMVYKCINGLQNTRWQVSDKVLEVAFLALQSGNGLALPQSEPLYQRPAPVPMEFQHLRGQELKEKMTAKEWDNFVDWKREAAGIYDAERERRAKFLEATRTIKQAEAYAKYEEVFFVYTADFRGRYNCQSSLLSPQGGDLQKGLLRFTKGLPLGAEGRYWLAVQGAGLWGNDKCSFNERVLFIEQMSEDIRDYASNPLTFKGWAGADKPWQFLNWCFEWADLMDWEEAGKPSSEFLSHLAPPNDGACSGIQHYSALLRDPIGGKAVNLVPSELPQDIYGEVAKVVISKLAKIMEETECPEDEVQEEWEAKKQLAKGWLNVGITRTLTKKPVMTLPYGSTRITCLESVRDYLSDLIKSEAKKAKAESRNILSVHPFTGEKDSSVNRSAAESFISGLIWSSIGQVVVAARAGMSFIKSVTRAIAAENNTLEWTTPTGFIVQQAIYKMASTRIQTQLMGRTDFVLLEPTDEIDTVRMQSSCAPNFIHSYDASHLTFAVCAMLDAGITDIAVIHDSFGCHAGYTHILRQILVDSFVDMYQKDNWLQKFREENEARTLVDVKIDVPEYLGLDLNVIKNSPYCFA